MKKDYESPAIREVGSLSELTQQTFNKVGRSTDIFSQEFDTQLFSSLTPG